MSSIEMLVAYLGCHSVSSGLANCTILFGRICSRAYPDGLGLVCLTASIQASLTEI